MTDCWSRNFNALSLDIDAERHAEYWLRGGRGSGKSTFIARKIILGMLAHPQASAVIFRKVAATLRQSVYEEMVKAIDALKLRPWCVFRLSPLEIQFRPTGQRILFRGADDPGKLKSITLSKGYFGYLWFEELAEFSGVDDVRAIAASVIRGMAEQRPIIFCSYNPPQSAQAWVNAESLRPEPGRMIHLSTYLDLPPEWIGDSFITRAEELKATNERAYRHMYLGEITGTGGQVFDNLVLRDISDAELETMDRFYNGLDFGFSNDPDALTRWAYSPGARTIYAVREFYGSHVLTDTLAGMVSQIAKKEIVWCDSEAPRDIAELQNRGIRAVSVRKGPGSVHAGIKWLQNLSAIVVDPRRTPNIAREFSQYEYAQDRYGNFLPDVPDKGNHTVDSTRYALNQMILMKVARVRGDIN